MAAHAAVGFWYRRMAHETLVRRTDAELAAGYASPVDQNLALGGIDEMLVAFLASPWWETEPARRRAGGLWPSALATSSGG